MSSNNQITGDLAVNRKYMSLTDTLPSHNQAMTIYLVSWHTVRDLIFLGPEDQRSLGQKCQNQSLLACSDFVNREALPAFDKCSNNVWEEIRSTECQLTLTLDMTLKSGQIQYPQFKLN